MSNTDNPAKPKRRPRYRGTHPRKYQEKYKELNPDLYTEDMEKVRSRGDTPAGSHRPICVAEILNLLNPKPGETALDVTLGYGGHSLALLERVLPEGRLIALDQDPIERPKAEARLRARGIPDSSLIIGATNFGLARSFLQNVGIPTVDIILADLGVSSMQIDDPERGFSFKVDAPLDLRMNPNQGEPAASLLARLTEIELVQILRENADEMRAEIIAKSVIKSRPKTTRELANVIREVVSKFSKRVQEQEGDAPIRRAFQALRIAVNDEFVALESLLSDIPYLLKPGGRVAVLSFHSGEDRRVKKSFQSLYRAGVYCHIAPEFIRPSLAEQHSNPRSKAAKLRWAVKNFRE